MRALRGESFSGRKFSSGLRGGSLGGGEGLDLDEVVGLCLRKLCLGLKGGFI